MKKFALIVAGGSGSRMGSEIPKQFMEMAGKPVLMHTIKAFLSYDPDVEVILVLPEQHFGLWEELCRRYRFEHPYRLGQGGLNRFESVASGLNLIEGDGLVFIHDGVRPLVSRATLQRCCELATEKGNAIPALKVVESVRWAEDNLNKPLDRNRVWLVQTPQTFRVSLIREAYGQAFREEFTDDASVLESLGYRINLTEGNRENIKITWPVDLLWAETLLSIRGNL